MINIVYVIMPVITMIAGFYFGYRIASDKELPEIKTPVEIIEEVKEKREAKELDDELQDYMGNIDNYPKNQKKIVR